MTHSEQYHTLPVSHEADVPSAALQPAIERAHPTHEAIHRLEDASIPLPMKIDALLVGLGEKPATQNRFASREWQSGSQPQSVSDAEVNEYVEIVQGLGVYVEIVPDKVVNPWVEYTRGTDGEVVKRSNPDWQKKVDQDNRQAWRTVLVARSSEDLDLIRAGDEQNDARLLGRAYGFPETATEAYLNGQPLYSSDVAEAGAPMRAFARYGLSAEHFSEELATAERWSRAVQQASPRLYSEMAEFARGAAR